MSKQDTPQKIAVLSFKNSQHPQYEGDNPIWEEEVNFEDIRTVRTELSVELTELVGEFVRAWKIYYEYMNATEIQKLINKVRNINEITRLTDIYETDGPVKSTDISFYNPDHPDSYVKDPNRQAEWYRGCKIMREQLGMGIYRVISDFLSAVVTSVKDNNASELQDVYKDITGFDLAVV